MSGRFSSRWMERWQAEQRSTLFQHLGVNVFLADTLVISFPSRRYPARDGALRSAKAIVSGAQAAAVRPTALMIAAK